MSKLVRIKFIFLQLVTLLLFGCGVSNTDYSLSDSKYDHLVTVASNPTWLVDNKKINNIEELKAELINLTGNSVLVIICIDTDKKDVIETIDIINSLNLKNVGINSSNESIHCN